MKIYFAAACLALVLTSNAEAIENSPAAIPPAGGSTRIAANGPAKSPQSNPAPSTNPDNKNGVSGKDKVTPDPNVGGIYTTEHRIKFSDNLYVWVACVIADGQTPDQMSAVLGGIVSGGAGLSSAGSITIAQGLLKVLNPFQQAFTPILQAIALKAGYAYCYHIKFKDNDQASDDLIFSTLRLASDPVSLPFATNSYLKRYTAKGVDPGTFVMNDNKHLLDIEYPACGHNSCPCRGQFCGIFNFTRLSIQTDTSDPVVAASLCIEWPVPNPTKSFIMSFGDIEKIADATARPTATDNVPVAPEFSYVEAAPNSCASRGFSPTN